MYVENSLIFAPFTLAIKTGTGFFFAPGLSDRPVPALFVLLLCIRWHVAVFLFTALAPRIMRVCAALTYVMVSARRGSGGGGGGAAKQEGEKGRGE